MTDDDLIRRWRPKKNEIKNPVPRVAAWRRGLN
jgi:hypothetical protein